MSSDSRTAAPGRSIMRAETERLGEERHDEPLILEIQREADDQHHPEREPQEGPTERDGVRVGRGLRLPEDSREAQLAGVGGDGRPSSCI